jgi:hypothetical protein
LLCCCKNVESWAMGVKNFVEKMGNIQLTARRSI